MYGKRVIVAEFTNMNVNISMTHNTQQANDTTKTHIHRNEEITTATMRICTIWNLIHMYSGIHDPCSSAKKARTTWMSHFNFLSIRKNCCTRKKMIDQKKTIRAPDLSQFAQPLVYNTHTHLYIFECFISFWLHVLLYVNNIRLIAPFHLWYFNLTMLPYDFEWQHSISIPPTDLWILYDHITQLK